MGGSSWLGELWYVVVLVFIYSHDKGNNKITELRTILQRESQSVDKHEYHYIPKFNLAKYYHPSQTMSVDKHEYHYIPKFNLANYYQLMF
jgi:hypothetical protein